MAGSARRLHVLVVDPEPESARVIQEAVAAEGWRVSVLGEPRGLLDTLRGTPTQVVVVDVSEAAGGTLLQRIREFDSDLCTIATTSRPSVETAVAAMKGQAFEYLPKPVDPVSLRRALHEAVRQKGLLVDLEQRINAEVGRRVRERRSEHRLTLKQVAKRTGLSISLISQIELGKSAASVSTLFKLARALRVQMTYFFETV